jgi:hypothetical protein
MLAFVTKRQAVVKFSIKVKTGSLALAISKLHHPISLAIPTPPLFGSVSII